MISPPASILESFFVSFVVAKKITKASQLRSTHEIAFSLFQKMDLAEWRRLRPPVNEQNYETPPEWAIFHLIEHEAGHAFQISSLIRCWQRLDK